MDIKQGRRKSFDVEFVEVTEENIQDVAEWCKRPIGGEDKDRYVKLDDKNAINARQTKAFLGDVVVHSVQLNTFKSFGKKAFNNTFEEILRMTDVVIHRDAGTGLFVSEEYTEVNPGTTVTENVKAHEELPRDADPS